MDEVSVLIIKAKEWIATETKQSSLFVELQQKILFAYRGECVGITAQICLIINVIFFREEIIVKN